MKKKIKLLTIAITTVLLSTTIAFAQDAPPPPPGGGHGGSGNQTAGAPIGGGLFILLGLGAAYGGKKLYDLRKEKLEE